MLMVLGFKPAKLINLVGTVALPRHEMAQIENSPKENTSPLIQKGYSLVYTGTNTKKLTP
ncbi:hypothetical protein BFP75_16775 [Maribacter sp. 4G9]|nr:hypothetical protein BFP75_16775 [Maribacter sp. 4G9]